MLVHALLAGAGVLLFIAPELADTLKTWLLASAALNFVLVGLEAFGPHGTDDATRAAKLTSGARWRRR